MLANELDGYKERGNSDIDENIQEIQELYTNERQQKKEKERIEEEEVILIKPYNISSLMSSSSSSFANEKVNNLLKYIKFIKFPYTDKNILTTTILSITMIQRGTRSQILEKKQQQQWWRINTIQKPQGIDIV